MNKPHRLVMVTVFGLLLRVTPGWGQQTCLQNSQCNPTMSDTFGNTAGGSGALYFDSWFDVDGFSVSGTENTAFGQSALIGNASTANVPGGNYNTAIGYSALFTNDTGSLNTASGIEALYSNTTGSDNTADGVDALQENTAGGLNTAIGAYALQDNSGAGGGGGDNTAIGAYALNANRIGGDNTALGAYSLNSNIGSGNTAIGRDALFENTGGNDNTAIGKYALYNNAAGTDNIALGYNAGSDLTSSASNNIDIGSAGVAGDSGVIRIGIDGQQSQAFIQGVFTKNIGTNVGKDYGDVYISNLGLLGTKKSSARYKRDIHDMGDASAKLMKLRPVTFRYKEDPTGTIQYGLVAEEVERVYPELVGHGADGKVETVHYSDLPGMLLNELQKQAHELQKQASENARQARQIAELKADRDRDRAQRATFEARLSALEQTTQARNGGRKLAASFDR